MERPTERFHFLDGLRGIASMLIVIHHTFSSNVVKWLTSHGMGVFGKYLYTFTQSGVVLFFVLSGIVLLRPYLRYDKKLKLGDYYYRRFRRIYPPYFGALVFGALVIILVHEYPTFYSDVLMWFSWEEFVSQMGIFNFSGPYFNLAWWSLQIEILFYLIVPIIVFAKGKNRMSATTLCVSIIIAMGIMTALQLYWHNNAPQKYGYINLMLNIYKAIDYPVCFILGVYLASRDVDNRQATLFVVLGIALILSLLIYPPLEYTGYGFMYAGVIALIFNSTKLQHFFSHPLFIWLGERSYSLFLIHFSVLYLCNYIVSHFTPDRNLLYGILTRGIGIPASIFFAMLLFHFVERKFAKGLVTADMFWPWQAKALNTEKRHVVDTPAV
jgi:peptidoglycan/LPS O-acetylase OafA/YrhL